MASQTAIYTIPTEGYINNKYVVQLYFKVQIKIINKTRDHIKFQKQTCDSIRKANLLLEAEIKQDEQKRKSLLSATETIKVANTEITKQTLLAKVEEQDIIERKKFNIKKYEEQYLNKQRFESNHSIQTYLRLNIEIENMKQSIKEYNNEIEELTANIYMKRRNLINSDINNILQLAEYLIHKRPTALNEIKMKITELNKLKNSFKKPTKDYASFSNKLPSMNNKSLSKLISVTSKDNYWSDFSKNLHKMSLALPKNQIQHEDLNHVLMPFDQVKKIKLDTPHTERPNTLDVTGAPNIVIKKYRPGQKLIDAYASSYFNISSTSTLNSYESERSCHSKLIHILEDIKLDTSKTCSLVNNLKTNELQDVNVTKASHLENILNKNELLREEKKQIDSEVIEEIDLTKKSSQNILVPPTQFLDLTQSSQEKRVTFNSVITIQNAIDTISSTVQHNSMDDIMKSAEPENLETKLNISTSFDNSYKEIQDTVFKKHNLNMSPQFTYTKKLMLHNVNKDKDKQLDLTTDGTLDNIQNVAEKTSKYFNEKNIEQNEDDNAKNYKKRDDFGKNNNEVKIAEDVLKENNYPNTSGNILFKAQKDLHLQDVDTKRPSLFSRCLPSTSNIINISMNTTCNEDIDSDFPMYIDSNILLSPKADDNQISTQDNNMEGKHSSQDVPNFLAGLKKTGFSFFGLANTENKTASDLQSQNNFNFNFGGEESVKRGGIFSMFK